MSIINRFKNFIYQVNVKWRDSYTIKHRDTINKEIENYLSKTNYFLGFGCVLKYYRDGNFDVEDLDYVIDAKDINSLFKLCDENKNFNMVVEDWNNDLPVMFKLKYKNRALIDFFVMNRINGKNAIFAKSVVKNPKKKIKSDNPKYKYASLSVTEYFYYKDTGTKLYKYKNSFYRFPNDIESYLLSIYGEKWKIPLNKEESYEENAKRCKFLDEMGVCYYNDRFA